MATRPERRPGDQDRSRAARCRPVFPFGIGRNAENRIIVFVGLLPFISTPRSLHFTLNHYIAFHRLCRITWVDHDLRDLLAVGIHGDDRRVSALVDLEIHRDSLSKRRRGQTPRTWLHSRRSGAHTKPRVRVERGSVRERDRPTWGHSPERTKSNEPEKLEIPGFLRDCCRGVFGHPPWSALSVRFCPFR